MPQLVITSTTVAMHIGAAIIWSLFNSHPPIPPFFVALIFFATMLGPLEWLKNRVFYYMDETHVILNGKLPINAPVVKAKWSVFLLFVLGFSLF
jgi:uncharacterized membrane protein YcaP (DUF421 family)